MSQRSDLKERRMSSQEGMLLWNQERTVLDVTELICEKMREKVVTPAELAVRLGKTKGYVTRLLDGTTNMSLRAISDVLSVLGYEFHPTCKPVDPSKMVHLDSELPMPPKET